LTGLPQDDVLFLGKCTGNMNENFFCEYQQHPSTEYQKCPSVLTLETPDLEDIARAIWQRQHDALNQKTINRDIDRRDQSLPSRYWDEFLLDASAVLSLLQRQHLKYQNRETTLLLQKLNPAKLVWPLQCERRLSESVADTDALS
jgi:hypothetical protein